jgi:hypothetical protein
MIKNIHNNFFSCLGALFFGGNMFSQNSGHRNMKHISEGFIHTSPYGKESLSKPNESCNDHEGI